LERVDGGGDERVPSEEPGVVEEGDFEVGVAGALADAVAVTVDSDAAADHEIDGLHLVDPEPGCVGRRSAHGGGLSGWERERCGVKEVEGLCLGELGHGHVDGLAICQRAGANGQLGGVGDGLDDLRVLPGGETG
jgi:hypothetical protein